MKRTIERFKISNQLDTREQEAQLPIEDPGQAAFARSLHRLDCLLREDRSPAPEPPPWLLASIMNEVRHEAARPEFGPRFVRSRTVVALVSAVLMLGLTIWLILTSGESIRTSGVLASHIDTEQALRNAVASGTQAITSPYDLEMENLAKDIDRATECIVASLP